MLDNGRNNTYACCSTKQLSSLSTSLTLSQVMLLRCPSCSENFAHLHCITTCSPNQSQTVQVTNVANVTGTDNITREAVVGYNVFLSSTFADSAFQSCKNVKIPTVGGFAIGAMCGRYGAKLCNAQYWYNFQGDSNNGLAPLEIKFNLLKPGETEGLPDGVIPYNGKTLKCNESTPSGNEACSCQDCEESCPRISAPPLPPGPFRLLGTDGFLVIAIILFCLLIFAFLFYLSIACWIKSRKKTDEEKGKRKRKDKDQNSIDVTQQVVDPSEVTCAERNSLAAQAFLTSKFQIWGTIMATYPLTVSLTRVFLTSHKQI